MQINSEDARDAQTGVEGAMLGGIPTS